MKRPLLGMLCVAACVPILVPASSGAVQITRHVRLPDSGRVARVAVDVPPPNRDGDAFANSEDRCPGTPGVAAYRGCPPPAPAPTPASPSTEGVAAPAPTSSSVATGAAGCGGITPYAGGGQCWAIPYAIVACESGGQDVPNADGSPATGYYQIEGGGGSGTKEEQDAAAAAMWASSGSAPWTASENCWG
jgi:hypothetical protein